MGEHISVDESSVFQFKKVSEKKFCHINTHVHVIYHTVIFIIGNWRQNNGSNINDCLIDYSSYVNELL